MDIINKESIEYWVSVLLKDGHSIDMTATYAALATAISKEIQPITEQEICKIAEYLIADNPTVAGYVSAENGKTYLGIPGLFVVWSELCIEVGLAVGRANPDDEEGWVDDWLTEQMPQTRAIFNAIRVITINGLSAASDYLAERTGVHPEEVFVTACETGESFDQANTRLRYEAKGLKDVNKDNVALH